MAIELRTVETSAQPPGYSHAALGRAGTLVFTAGAVPLDAEGRLVGGGDAVAQAEQVVRNLLIQLEAGGARPGDVAKTTVYVTGASYEMQSAVWQVVRSSPIGSAPSTLGEVPTLCHRGQLVEIEAIALLD
ncbi:MAG TPA: RidA family protein [Actinomycetota bacterium]|nr:RidA family protein [Actinomycetota bacterium]